MHQKITSIMNMKTELTVCLSVYNTIYDVRVSTSPGVPRILITGKSTPVKGCIGVRDGSHERLRDGVVGLQREGQQSELSETQEK